jgi:hypothetical protein
MRGPGIKADAEMLLRRMIDGASLGLLRGHQITAGTRTAFRR